MKKIFLFLGGLVMVIGLNAEARFTLRFYDKEIYYPDRPVQVLATVKNTGNSPFWFSMPNNPVFHLKFRVMALGNSGLYLPNSDKFNENRYNNQPVFFRDVSLKPGEEFSYSFNLLDFVDIKEAGVYSVEAEFFPSLLPEFQSGREQSLLKELSGDRPHQVGDRPSHEAGLSETASPSQRSNVLTLSVRPPIPSSSLPQYEQHMDVETGEILQRENLSPDAVVTRTLEARQSSQEEKFFLYLNLEDLYKRSPQYKRTYLSSSLEDRERLLSDFRQRLWQHEEALTKNPASFEIIYTSYQEKEGLVRAKLRFDGGDFYEIKEYTYALKKSRGYWEIYDYQVRNVTTEPKKSMVPKSKPATNNHSAPAASQHGSAAAPTHSNAPAPAHGAGH